MNGIWDTHVNILGTWTSKKLIFSLVTAIKYHKKWNILKSASIEIRGIKVNEKPSLLPVQPVIQAEVFVPFSSQVRVKYENYKLPVNFGKNFKFQILFGN